MRWKIEAAAARRRVALIKVMGFTDSSTQPAICVRVSMAALTRDLSTRRPGLRAGTHNPRLLS
jgi:hypothetical protein